jgi:hypothetical protein
MMIRIKTGLQYQTSMGGDLIPRCPVSFDDDD